MNTKTLSPGFKAPGDVEAGQRGGESIAPATGGTRRLQIGAVCDPISKQLAGLISEQQAIALDSHNDAINHCYVLGFVDARSTDRARKKLLAMCQKAVRDHRDARR